MVLVSLVAIVAIVTLVLQGNASMEGAPVYTVSVDSRQEFCTDDDPENDRFVAGTVKLGVVEYLDYCMGDDMLNQYHCPTSNTVRFTRPFKCPNG